MPVGDLDQFDSKKVYEEYNTKICYWLLIDVLRTKNMANLDSNSKANQAHPKTTSKLFGIGSYFFGRGRSASADVQQEIDETKGIDQSIQSENLAEVS